ncbi:MAG: hypothetical protein ACI308_11515 [Muribaculaceae bacterium]
METKNYSVSSRTAQTIDALKQASNFYDSVMAVYQHWGDVEKNDEFAVFVKRYNDIVSGLNEKLIDSINESISTPNSYEI